MGHGAAEVSGKVSFLTHTSCNCYLQENTVRVSVLSIPICACKCTNRSQSSYLGMVLFS